MAKATETPTISGSVSMAENSYQNGTTTPQTAYLKPETPEVQTTAKNSCFGNVIRTFKLEIVAFFMMFSYVLPRITSTSMILEKVCLVNFGYPENICHDLSNYTELKPPIERLATNYQLAHILIQTAPAAVLACLFGPWSDNHGRKFPVILAVSGLTLDAFGSSIVAHYLNSRVEFYFIPAAFTGLSGGLVSILAVIYSYVSDLTPAHGRTIKYAYIEIAAGTAIPLGVATGGWVYNFLGYPPVFLISTVGLFIGLLCIVFFLPETRGLDENVSWKKKLEELFSFKTFKESFIATSKKRPNQGRKQIILLIISQCFIVISSSSTNDINFLYVHHQFNWGNTTYSTFTAIYSIIAIILLVIVLPLFKRVKVGDITLGLIGTSSLLIKFIGIGLSFNEIIFHAANLLGLLAACGQLAVRSRISKVVSNDDIGKVFSFVATAESLLPVLTTVLISQIFNAFLIVYPGMPYIILALLLTIPFSVFIWMSCLPNLSYEEVRQREKYVKIEP